MWLRLNHPLKWLWYKSIKLTRMYIFIPIWIQTVTKLSLKVAQLRAITEGLLMTSGGIKIHSPAGLFTGNAGWLCPFNALTAFSSPSPVMWQAEISSSRSRGMVIVVATSSGRRSSWRRLPEICSSVRLDWSFKARRSGLREVGPKLRPHTDTEELPSCTSHSRVTRLFSSAGRQKRWRAAGWVSQNVFPCIFVCVAHPLPGCDRPSCSAQGEEGDPRNKLQPGPKTQNTEL